MIKRKQRLCCKACGEFESSWYKDERRMELWRAGFTLIAGELDYCKECADEIFRSILTVSYISLAYAGVDEEHKSILSFNLLSSLATV